MAEIHTASMVNRRGSAECQDHGAFGFRDQRLHAGTHSAQGVTTDSMGWKTLETLDSLNNKKTVETLESLNRKL